MAIAFRAMDWLFPDGIKVALYQENLTSDVSDIAYRTGGKYQGDNKYDWSHGDTCLMVIAMGPGFVTCQGKSRFRTIITAIGANG
jgi:hypothetical protein